MSEEEGSPWVAWITKLAIPASAVIVSMAAALLARSVNNAALVRSIEAQTAAQRSQREMSEANLAASLLPDILKGTISDREAALRVLSSVAPGQALLISQALLESPASAEEKAVVRIVRSQSVEKDIARAFEQHVSSARKYDNGGLAAGAAREYLAAAENLPRNLAAKVDQHAIAAGRERVAKSDFDAATAYFSAAFRAVNVDKMEPP